MCKLLYHASAARSIWTGLIATHRSKVSPSFTILEKPAALHTSEELERLFLRWKKVERSWLRSTSDLKPALLTPPGSPGQHHLLRGGRWLLYSSHNGEVYYCNLEARFPEFSLLSPSPLPGHSFRFTFMAVDEDLESPMLSFNIAICCVPGARDDDPCLDIWHGTLVLNDRNQSIRLQAERSFHLPLFPYLGSPQSLLSLFGSCVAYDTSGPGKSDIAIINWKNLRTGVQYSRKIVARNSNISLTSVSPVNISIMYHQR